MSAFTMPSANLLAQSVLSGVFVGALYGLRIPVLANTLAELDWPFDQQNLALWCAPKA